MPHLANLAEMGNDDAALIFAWALEEGIGVALDKDRALLLWERCAKNGNPEALVQIGAVFEEKGDHVKAFSSYLEASRKGSIHGTYSFSRALSGGLDVLKDYKQAFELMEKAREAGMAQAYHQASHYYDASFDESPQNENAENSFRLQLQGYQRGARNAVCKARFYFNGYGVTKNVTKGLELLTEAAKTSPEAQLEIIRRMEENDGIVMDKPRLLDWKRKLLATYRAAARLGHMGSLIAMFQESSRPENTGLLGEEYSTPAILEDMLKYDAFPQTPGLVNSVVWGYVENASKSEPDRKLGSQLIAVMLDASSRVTGEDRAMLLDTLAHLYEINGDIVRAREVQAEAVTLTDQESVKEYYAKLKQR
jgi:TPR repeat protein